MNSQKYCCVKEKMCLFSHYVSMRPGLIRAILIQRHISVWFHIKKQIYGSSFFLGGNETETVTAFILSTVKVGKYINHESTKLMLAELFVLFLVTSGVGSRARKIWPVNRWLMWNHQCKVRCGLSSDDEH